MYYIIQGYRDSFLYRAVLATTPLTAYFWFVAAAAFVLGALIFRRLKPQFADVL